MESRKKGHPGITFAVPSFTPPHGRLLDSSDIHTPTLCWPGILLSCLSMMPGQANDPSRALPFLKLQEIFPRSGSLWRGAWHVPPQATIWSLSRPLAGPMGSVKLQHVWGRILIRNLQILWSLELSHALPASAAFQPGGFLLVCWCCDHCCCFYFCWGESGRWKITPPRPLSCLYSPPSSTFLLLLNVINRAIFWHTN